MAENHLQNPEPLPGKGVLGWLGRQVGYVRKAIKANPAVVYRQDNVEEAEHPTDPKLKLRRTTIDEVIVRPNKNAEGDSVGTDEMRKESGQ